MISLADLPTLALGGVLWHYTVKAVRGLRSRPAYREEPRELLLPGDVVVARVLVTIPKAAARADVSDWLNLMLGGFGIMSKDNALWNCEVETHALAWEDAETTEAYP